MARTKGLRVATILILLGLSLSGCGLLFGRPPVAHILATPIAGKPPLVVDFDGTGSYDPDGEITVYKWDFGDGTTASGARVSHTYSGAGFYAVTLTVKDESGKRAKDIRVIKSFSFTRRAIPTGDGPTAAAAADFNGDGSQDLVVVNQFSDRATILLGSEDGSFRAREMNLGDGPVNLVAADLDKDGKLDLAVANLIAGTVSILLGNGDGTFKRFKDQSVGNGPRSLAAVDLNNDGHLDLAVVNDFCDDISLLWGEGNGDFIEGNTLKDVSLQNLKSVTWGDFNRDGNPDLAAVALDSSNLGIFLGSGQHDFPNLWLFPTGPSPLVVRQTDLDGDGKDDLIVAHREGLALHFGWGSGPQMFHPPLTLQTNLANSVTLLDVDEDDNVDLLITDPANNQVTILIGRGERSFEPAFSFDVGEGPTAALGLDANDDGRIDLVTTDQDDDTITILLNATP